jgi:hypothetical protein
VEIGDNLCEVERPRLSKGTLSTAELCSFLIMRIGFCFLHSRFFQWQ